MGPFGAEVCRYYRVCLQRYHPQFLEGATLQVPRSQWHGSTHHMVHLKWQKHHILNDTPVDCHEDPKWYARKTEAEQYVTLAHLSPMHLVSQAACTCPTNAKNTT